MALEDILKEIEERARAKASEIEEEGKKEAERIIREAEERARTLIDEAKARAEQEKKGEMDRVRATENIEKRKRILEEKKRIIADVIERAVAELRQSEEYGAFMKRVADAAKGAERIVVDGKDKKFFGREKALEESELLGGAIITRGEITVDYSLDGLLQERIDDLENRIEGELFGHE